MGTTMRRITLVALVIGVVGFGATVVQGEKAKAQSDDMQRFRSANVAYGKGQRLFAKKQLEKAVEELTTCIDLVPSFADCRLLLAKAYYQLKRYDEALVQIEAGTNAFPVMSAMLQSLGQSRSDDYERRRADAQAQLNAVNQRLVGASGPARSPIAAEAARLEAYIQDLDRELQAGRKEADSSAVPAEYFFFHGNILLRLQRLDEAVVQYQKALEINPAYSEASNNLASLYYSAKKPQEALAVLTAAEKNGATVNPELKQAILAALPN